MTPWTLARQAPLFMGFYQQEYWNGLPFPPAGDPPNSGTETVSLTSLDEESPDSSPLHHLRSPNCPIKMKKEQREGKASRDSYLKETLSKV